MNFSSRAASLVKCSVLTKIYSDIYSEIFLQLLKLLSIKKHEIQEKKSCK
jgi:hypothetical protein